MYYLKDNPCSVYCAHNDKEHLLLVDASLVVINGEWQLEKIDGGFAVSFTKERINIRLLGHIIYDGNYNRTLRRFQNGEGIHLPDEASQIVQPVIEEIVNEICKKKYYGIDCSCIKCKR